MKLIAFIFACFCALPSVVTQILALFVAGNVLSAIGISLLAGVSVTMLFICSL